jgi:adenine deaminase
MVSLKERIRVASGEGRADLLIKNGRVVNVFSTQIERKDVAIFDGKIVGFGDYPAKKIVDVKGDFLCPGLIDGHVHIESSMVTIPQFARAVVPNGTTSVIIDPHEIANVIGLRGIRFMAESVRGIPLNVFMMAPSCVPATHMETSGAVLRATEIKSLLKEPWVNDELSGGNLPRPGGSQKDRRGKGETNRWPRPPALREVIERLSHSWNSIRS